MAISAIRNDVGRLARKICEFEFDASFTMPKRYFQAMYNACICLVCTRDLHR